MDQHKLPQTAVSHNTVRCCNFFSAEWTSSQHLLISTFFFSQTCEISKCNQCPNQRMLYPAGTLSRFTWEGQTWPTFPVAKTNNLTNTIQPHFKSNWNIPLIEDHDILETSGAFWFWANIDFTGWENKTFSGSGLAKYEVGSLCNKGILWGFCKLYLYDSFSFQFLERKPTPN